MKNILLLLFVCFISCTPPGDLMRFTYKIEKGGALNEVEKSVIQDQIQNRLAKFGFRESEVTIEGNDLVVYTKINIASDREVTIFKSLFESNKLGIWEVFRVIDPQIAELDTASLLVDNFQPYFKLPKGYYTKEVLGVSSNENKLDDILSQLIENTKQVNNSKLYWSKKTKGAFYTEEDNFELYMINSRGNKVAPITEKGIEKVTTSKDQNNSDSYVINFQLNKETAPVWTKMTEDAFNGGNRALSIIINNEVITVPRVMGPIYSGNFTLASDYTKKESEELARALSAGRLDFNLKLIGEELIKDETK